MALSRRCSECEPGVPCPHCGAESLAGKPPKTKTCCAAHRQARGRRIARANKQVKDFEQQNNAASSEIAAIVRREAPDVVTRVLRDEIKPVVREALTEDVLRAVNALVGLTPAAVSALQEDLGSEDPVVRQRAYTLQLKYTVGHPALVRPADTEPQGQMVVNFNLPRPTDLEAVADVPAEITDSEVLRVCDMCGQEKAEAEFVAGSDRCETCATEWKAAVLKEFG